MPPFIFGTGGSVAAVAAAANVFLKDQQKYDKAVDNTSSKAATVKTSSNSNTSKAATVKTSTSPAAGMPTVKLVSIKLVVMRIS